MKIKCPVCDTDQFKTCSSHAGGSNTVYTSFTCTKCNGRINATIFKNGDEIESMEIKYNKNKQSECEGSSTYA